MSKQMHHILMDGYNYDNHVPWKWLNILFSPFLITLKKYIEYISPFKFGIF
jgi:uncharacterized membrane protein